VHFRPTAGPVFLRPRTGLVAQAGVGASRSEPVECAALARADPPLPPLSGAPACDGRWPFFEKHMTAHILMNVVDEQEMRVAVIRNGRLESLIHERLSCDGHHLGNIYKAKIANVEPSLDAAFVDLGGTKNGFIHVDDFKHDRRSRARIEDVIRDGQEIVVQVTKEAIRDKGACLTTYLSIPGRYLVLVQKSDATGISKKIDDRGARRRLQKIIGDLEAPEGFGFIVRTAGADRSEEELRLDHEYLMRLWKEIDATAQRAQPPACIYREADVVVRTLRELVDEDVEDVIIDSERYYDEARAFAMVFMPELVGRICFHQEDLPIFSFYGVEDRLATMLDRKVELPSGGNIVIEQTEAMVSIDVNSSKNREGGDVAQTALQTNLEAVQVIAEQLVLRDLGGLIIVDFIDMDSRDHQRLVQLAMRKALLKDRARTQVAMMSRFGLLEMTRQRTRPSHKLVSSTDCPYCAGTGSIKTPETFEIEVMRAVGQALSRQALSRLEVVVPQDMAIHILNHRAGEISNLERSHDCRVTFVGDSLMKTREYRLVPSQRRRRGKKKVEKPVHPGLLASWMETKGKVLSEARELMDRGPEAIDRELQAVYSGRSPRPGAAETSRGEGGHNGAEAPNGAAGNGIPTLAANTLRLRELLFNPPQPFEVGAADEVARRSANAKNRASSGPGNGSRRRRRRGSRSSKR